MKTVVLTGATGFLGSQVLAALLRRGYIVHAVSRVQTRGPDAAGVTWHSVNLFERTETHALLETIRPDGLIHLAWESAHGIYWQSTSNLEWLAASLLLLQDFSRLGGQRAVVAGSSAEYQWGSLIDLDERLTPTLPDSLYGTSKDVLRAVLAKWAPNVGLSWAWGRLFNIYGPSESPARLVPRVINTLLEGRQLPFDRGAVLRDFMHVADAGDAMAALFDSKIDGPVNLASGIALSVNDLIVTIAEYLGARERVQFGVLPEPTGQPDRIVARVDRLRDEVGWQTSTCMLERLHQTCDWWKSAKNGNRQLQPT